MITCSIKSYDVKNFEVTLYENGEVYTLGTGEKFKLIFRVSPTSDSEYLTIEQTDSLFNLTSQTFAKPKYYEELYLVRADGTEENLTNGWFSTADTSVSMVYAEDDIERLSAAVGENENAVRNIQGSWIKTGKIRSNAKTSTNEPVTTIDLDTGAVSIKRADGKTATEINKYGCSIPYTVNLKAQNINNEGTILAQKELPLGTMYYDSSTSVTGALFSTGTSMDSESAIDKTLIHARNTVELGAGTTLGAKITLNSNNVLMPCTVQAQKDLMVGNVSTQAQSLKVYDRRNDTTYSSSQDAESGGYVVLPWGLILIWGKKIVTSDSQQRCQIEMPIKCGTILSATANTTSAINGGCVEISSLNNHSDNMPNGYIEVKVIKNVSNSTPYDAGTQHQIYYQAIAK